MEIEVRLDAFIHVQGWERPKVISKPKFNQLEEPFIEIGFYKDFYKGPNGQDMFLNTNNFTLTFSKSTGGNVTTAHNDLLDGKLKPEYEFEIHLQPDDYKLLNQYKDTELYIEFVRSILRNYMIRYHSYSNTTHNWGYLSNAVDILHLEEYKVFKHPYDTVKLKYAIYPNDLPF